MSRLTSRLFSASGSICGRCQAHQQVLESLAQHEQRGFNYMGGRAAGGTRIKAGNNMEKLSMQSSSSYPLVNQHNYAKWLEIVFFSLSMVIFHSYVKIPEATCRAAKLPDSDSLRQRNCQRYPTVPRKYSPSGSCHPVECSMSHTLAQTCY